MCSRGRIDTKDTMDTELRPTSSWCPLSLISGDAVKKLRVGVIYGGRSGEHEVSLASAAAVFQNLDPERYEAIPIRINKDGRWVLPSAAPRLTSAAAVIGAVAQASAGSDGKVQDESAHT